MTKFCTSVDIYDLITCATFCDDRLRGLGVARGRISSFPIDLRRRPYNTLALPCECVNYVPGRSLRSSQSNLVCVPSYKLYFGARSFRVAAPTVWNSLPADIRACAFYGSFTRQLKTFYFNNAF